MNIPPSTPPDDPLHGLNPESLMDIAALPTDADTQPLAPHDWPSQEQIAKAFPDLEILDLIGHGGMSVVYRARQPKLDRIIALKILPKSLAAKPGFTERFTREGRVLARLSHPNIVTVHDFGESGGFGFLIMEFVDGVNLRQAMRIGRFTPEQALTIIPAICDALQFAHSRGVLHRDIKPENILLDSKGRVKIADFGIAKIIGEESGDAILLTQSGARLGTAPYMAPEQIEQPSSVDHRADIYSLGVVFYEMLTGELPLGRFAAPSEKSAVNGGMDEVVFRALEKERGRRQQSVGEFKTQIEGVSQTPRGGRLPLRWDQPFEYKSKRTLWGLPLVHVVQGPDPVTGRRREACGILAIGDKAKGVFAFGGIARGAFACGGLAIGGFAFGGCGIGLITLGGLAIGLFLAIGGMCLGGFAAGGGMALGWHAIGGVAWGWHAIGGTVIAHRGMGGSVDATEVVRNLQDMPAVTQALHSLLPYTSVLGVLWIPLTAFMILMIWWARRQTASAEPVSLRVFWLIPGLFLDCLAALMIFGGSLLIGGSMTKIHLIPTLVGAGGILFCVLSQPLWLRLIPRNPLYGVRLPSTLKSDEYWYDVNAHFGKQLFWWSLAVMAAGIVGFYQLPRHQESYPWAAVALALTAVIASVISTLLWMRRNPPGKAIVKANLFQRASESVLPALVLAFFIKAFVFAAYTVPVGSEPGVIKGSRWFASRLDTGFSEGDLIVFLHESGKQWLARVVKTLDNGLQLKRGGAPEEFFMPWDKIVGKMQFSYWPLGGGVVKP